MSYKTVSVIGGDLRSLWAAKFMERGGFKVLMYGWERNYAKGTEVTKDTGKATESDVIILPVPYNKGGEINAPFKEEGEDIEGVIAKISSKSFVFGGNIPSEISEVLREKGAAVTDLMKSPSVLMKNAALTAEGAISAVMKNTDFAVLGSKCLVTGYGRIAKILAKYLKALGAEVLIAARSEKDREEAEIFGYKAIKISEISEKCKDCNVIFNTVPSVIMGDEVLSRLGENTLIAELASKPGGIDLKSAEENNIKILHEPGLPGRFAPISAGKILYEEIIKILNER